MIVFVYYCVCLSFVYCLATGTTLEDYSNDSPDLLPKIEHSRYKIGANFTLKCYNPNYKRMRRVGWQFKKCNSSTFNGVECDESDIYSLQAADGKWQHLAPTRGKQLEIIGSVERNIGIYRCIWRGHITCIHIIDLIGTNAFDFRVEKPKILNLNPSNNITIYTSDPLVIQCNVSSHIMPEIRWFRDCSGGFCDTPTNDSFCYCPIPSVNSPNSMHQLDNTHYMSKLTVYNTRTSDSGIYTCLVISNFGNDLQNITVRVLHSSSSRSLFLIPFLIVLIVVVLTGLCMCYYCRRKKEDRRLYEQKQLIRRLQQIEIVTN